MNVSQYWFNARLRVKILIPFFLIFICASVLGTLYVNHVVNRTLASNVEVRLKSLAPILSEELHRQERRLAFHAKSFADEKVISEQILSIGQSRLLKVNTLQYLHSEHINYLGAYGINTDSSDPLYPLIVKGLQGKTVTGLVKMNKGESGVLHLVGVAPVFGVKGQREVVVLETVLDQEYLQGLVENFGVEMTLFNDAGQPVVGTPLVIDFLQQTPGDILGVGDFLETATSTTKKIIALAMGGDPYRGVLAPFTVNYSRVGVMALLIPVQQFAIFQRLLVGEAVIFSLALFVAVGLLYLLLIRWITTPVKALMKVARKMMDGEPVEPVMITTGDEIGVLARTFNELTDKLDLRERELLQKAKEATYRSQELNAILEQMADAVVVTNQDYVIEYMNRTAIDIFGAQLGETCYKALNYRKDTCNPCSIKELLIKKKKLFKYSMQDSAGRFFEIIAQPLTGMDGKPKVISLRRDVTERIRHFQKEKELQQKIQEERIAAINQVVVSIKHGVNNSLAAISTALRLFDMDSEAFSDRDREIFNLLDDEVKKITDIVAKLSTITDPVVSNYTDSIQMIDLDQIK